VHARMKGIGALAVVTTALLVLAPAAGADGGLGGETGTTTGGDNHGGRFSAWAYYAQATGGGKITSSECHLKAHPELPAHYEWNVVPSGDGTTYTVFYDCVLNGKDVDDIHHLYPNMGEEWDWLDTWTVTPAPPEDMIADAIARLNPEPPKISTSPGGGVPGLVNLPVYLSFAEPLTRQQTPITNGPITVIVWAEPHVDEVVWDTGDGREACNTAPGPGGTCAHLYAASSAGHANGYQITATITYTGGYAVAVNGNFVDGVNDIGNIVRTSTINLPVQEAQAINDDG
jgi:hypothetical protein